MEAGLMEIMQSLNKSWTFDSLYGTVRPGKVLGKRLGGNVRILFYLYL